MKRDEMCCCCTILIYRFENDLQTIALCFYFYFTQCPKEVGFLKNTQLNLDKHRFKGFHIQTPYSQA